MMNMFTMKLFKCKTSVFQHVVHIYSNTYIIYISTFLNAFCKNDAGSCPIN